ncbi:lysozyme inhibitor LprI family protein [Paraburkholderia pallida]|uniref:DUF1311 domain-containing protein n=1 Tax=Paraburkholderia pallida TaxID=2547399 RepID=A0A4P7CZ57_9BURK|nr:lysozyme inhibitor LprI family protein [Paraburkholderia pallida]QBR00137.1 DUF1311 domain-containing protein [Paraburkholderia pallida]
MYFTRFLILAVGIVMEFFAMTAVAEPTLHLNVEAAHVEANTHNIALLVKVTDNDSGKDSSDRITTTLPVVSSCVASFKDDIQWRVGPCYGVQIWENGIPVESLKVRVLDTIGDSNWTVLTWKSNSPHPVSQRSIKAIIGASGGWYTDNDREVFLLGSLPSFNPARPYAWLYDRDDRALNDLYQQILSGLSGKNAERNAENLRTDERLWVGKKERYCRASVSSDADRCLWLVTANRIEALRQLGNPDDWPSSWVLP